MTHSRYGIIKPWMFVVLGALLVLGGAALNNVAMARRSAALVQLSTSAELLDQKIQQRWQQTKSLEYEEHTGTMILLFGSIAKTEPDAKAPAEMAVGRFVESILLSGQLPKEKAEAIRTMMQQGGSTTEAMKQVFDEIDRNRVEAIATINALDAEKLALVQQQAVLREELGRLNALALFLQVMGLILVLAKDIVRARR